MKWVMDTDSGNTFMVFPEGDETNSVLIAGRIKREADARLIAAAPEMLAALKAVCEDLVHWRVGGNEMEQARAAISKAEGKE